MFVSGLKAVTSESIQANQEKQGCAGTELTTQRCWNSAIFPWAWNRSGSRSLLFVWVDVSSRVYPINEPFIEYFLKIGPMWGLLAVNCQKKDLLCVLRCARLQLPCRVLCAMQAVCSNAAVSSMQSTLGKCTAVLVPVFLLCVRTVFPLKCCLCNTVRRCAVWLWNSSCAQSELFWAPKCPAS